MAERYAAWYAASKRSFRRSGDGLHPSDAAYDAIISGLQRSSRALLARSAAPYLLDLGFGDTETLQRLTGIIRRETGRIAVCAGIDFRADYVEWGRRKLGPDSVLLQGDIFEKDLDVGTKLGLKDSPAVVIASHVAYYGHESSRIGLNADGSSLVALIENVERALGPESVAIFLHTVESDLDGIKRQYSDIVEADGARALLDALREKGVPFHTIHFSATSYFPAISSDIWRALEGAQRFSPGENSRLDDDGAEEARLLVEFYIHRDLADLAPGDREGYLSAVQSLVAASCGEINRTYAMCIAVRPDATPEFGQEVRRIAEDTQRTLQDDMIARSAVQDHAEIAGS